MQFLCLLQVRAKLSLLKTVLCRDGSHWWQDVVVSRVGGAGERRLVRHTRARLPLRRLLEHGSAALAHHCVQGWGIFGEVGALACV